MAREHSISLRVPYGDTDQMGVVYHPNYLRYFEQGRTELMRASGLAYSELEKRGFRLVVTESSCHHHAPAAYDEVLGVLARVTEVGRASIRFDYRISGPSGALVCEGSTRLACVDREARPARLPADVTERLLKQ
jgi:acyl-CoA thioester hydrolase